MDSANVNSTNIPGWFGKVPFLGDFASRRLPQDFLSTWDDWLQHSIAASKAQLGDRWTDIYLQSPFWRFVLWPGVIDDNIWAGILMPSVDSAGRYFPLTLTMQFEPAAKKFFMLASLQNWFAALEQVALATLDTNFSIEQLENRLEQNFPSPSPAAMENQTAIALSKNISQSTDEIEFMQLTDELPALLRDAAMQFFFDQARGCTLWWQDASDDTAKFCLLKGLPRDTEFSKLLLGNVSNIG